MKRLLAFTKLWADSADDRFMIFILTFSKKRGSKKRGSDISYKLSPQGDNLCEMSKSVFLEKYEKIFQIVIC